MVTFRAKARELLAERGMFDSDVDEVMEKIIADPANQSMKDRWNDKLDDYPSAMRGVLWLAVRRAALEHIDANCPQAWFRPLFADE